MWENLYTIEDKGVITGSDIIVTLCCIISFFVWYIFRNRFDEKTNIRIRKFIYFLVPFWILMLYITFSSGFEYYNETILKYKEGDFYVVEGYVENYHENNDIYKHQSDDESFLIDNVKFYYRDIYEQPGYHKIRKNGGVIKGNGQYLKIYYTAIEINEEPLNVILRIDEKVR